MKILVYKWSVRLSQKFEDKIMFPTLALQYK
jgi:hypothetical protein